MNFTPNIILRLALGGALSIAAVGLIESETHIAPPPTMPDEFQKTGGITAVPAVLTMTTNAIQIGDTQTYQPVSWHKSKHWWKRNAPIIGGAGGGALVGGLAGGGKGALIGGAIGGGGGYLYKRYHHHHPHHRYRQ